LRARRRIAAALAVAALLFSGCGGEGPRTVAHPIRDRSVEFLHDAAADGPVLVEVLGQPFAAAVPGVDAGVVAAMNEARAAPRVRFTADPVAAPEPETRVVVIFRPPADVTGRSLCAGEVPPLAGRSRPAEVEAFAAFCVEDKVWSEVTGRMAGVTRLDDPGFGALIAQMTRDLFPPVPRERRPDPCDDPFQRMMRGGAFSC